MATGAGEYIDATTAASFVPEIWSKITIVARESKLLMAELVDRRFEKDVMAFGDTVRINDISNLTVQSKALSDNAATLYETVTESTQSLTIATWHYQAIAIETATKKQVNLDLLKAYGPKQQYALAQAVDDVLAGLIDNFSQIEGALLANLTDENWRRGIQYLDDADAPADNRYALVSAAEKNGLTGLDHFVHGDYSKINADVNANTKSHALGTWRGVTFFWSTNVEGTNAAGHDNGIWHREALALVMQMEPTTHAFFDIDSFTFKVAVEQLSGTKEIRDNHGVFMQGM